MGFCSDDSHQSLRVYTLKAFFRIALISRSPSRDHLLLVPIHHQSFPISQGLEEDMAINVVLHHLFDGGRL